MANRVDVTRLPVAREIRFAVLLVALCSAACSAVPVSGGSPASGRVTEAGSGRPIEGAVVVVYWEGTVPIKGSHACVHVETAVTDREGRYRTHEWRFDRPTIYGDHEMRYSAYKPGMQFSYVRLADLEMKSWPGSREDRLKELQLLARTARCSGQPSLGIADLKQAIAAEVRGLVRGQAEESTYFEEALALAQSEREAALRFNRMTQPKERGEQ
jgi:hypothetical protein